MEDEDVNIPPVSSEGGEGDEPTPEPLPGEKTDPALLLESLQKERQEKKALKESIAKMEMELSTLKNVPDDDVFSDEGKVLERKILALGEQLDLKDVREKYPVLKDKSSEFNEFRKDYPGIEMEKAAKLFLSENGMLDSKAPARKGLEPVGGGTRTPLQTGMTPEDVSKLRTTNFRKYSQLVREGKIKV